MHHFGEDMTKGWIEDDQFVIEAQNHSTGASVTMRGPTQGVLDDATEVVDEALVKVLAGRFAHFLRENLNPGPKLQARSR
jgi:hypothetical protein